MKKGLIIAGCVLSATVLAVLIVPSFFDWNTQKTRIESVATDALGQPVTLEGDIGLSLLPTPRLKAEGLSIGSRNTLEQGPYISAGLLDVRVAFFPLLSGKVEAGKVVLRDTQIVLLTGQQETDDAPIAGEAAAAPDITLPSVDIENATITLIEAGTGEETTVSQIDLAVTAKSTTGPFSADGSLRYGALPIALSLQTGDVASADFPFDLRFDVGGDADASFVVSGSAGNVLSDMPRVDAKLELRTPDAGRAIQAITNAPNPALDGKAFRLASPLSFEAGTLYLADVQVTLDSLAMTGEVAARTKMQPMKVTAKLRSSRIDMATLIAEPEPNTPLLEAIEVDLPKDIDAVIDMDIESLTGMPVALNRVQVTARLNSGNLDVTQASALLPGGVTASSAGSFQSAKGILLGTIRAQVKGANAQPLMQQIMGPGAAMPAGPLPLNATIDAFVEPSGLRVGALVGQLDAMQISGSGRLDYGVKPAITVRANINDINLDDWTADTSAQVAQQDSSSAFNGTLNFDVGIERLRRAGQVFQGLTLKGALKDNQLTLTSARLGDAASALVDVTGNITNMTSDAPQLDLRFKAKASSANQLLALGGLEPFDLAENAGRVDMTGSIKGSTTEPQLQANGAIGALALDTQATIKDLNAETPATSGSATLTVPSLAAWLQGLGMAEQSSVGKEAQPVTLVATFKNSAQKTTATTDIQNAKGLAKVVYGQDGDFYDLDLGVSAASITDYLRALGFAFDPARARLGGLDIAMQMAGPLNALTFKTLKADIGPAKLTGTGKLDVSGEVSLVDLRLTGKNLDLAELLPEAKTGAKAVSSGSGERWSKEPLDLAMLENVDGAITLDLDRLTLQDYELKNARLSAGSKGKSVKIALDRGDLFDGPATFILAINAASTPTMSLDMAIKDGNIAAATQSSAAIEPLTGTFDVTGSFSGTGGSEYAIVQSLQGDASFSARDGMINGVDIVQLNERFGSLSTVNDFLRIVGSALKGGQTAYQLIAVDAVANKGNITTQNMRTQIDGGAQASLEARINLPAWQVSGKGAFSLEDHPGAPPVGVTITGPLDTATVTYETKKMQEYIGVRLGAAVLKGAVKGEGFGLKDLLSGGTSAQDTQNESADTPETATDWSASSSAAETSPNTAPEEEDEAAPEEQIRDLILEGLFGKKKSN